MKRDGEQLKYLFSTLDLDDEAKTLVPDLNKNDQESNHKNNRKIIIKKALQDSGEKVFDSIGKIETREAERYYEDFIELYKKYKIKDIIPRFEEKLQEIKSMNEYNSI